MTVLSLPWDGRGSISHNLVPCIVPVKIILIFRRISNLFFVKIAIDPASHNEPIAHRDTDARWEKICVVLYSGERSGMSISALCVDCILWLFGRITCTPSLVGLMFFSGILLGEFVSS